MRVYGVVQSVDHAGRTARVKWFKTYASQDSPRYVPNIDHERLIFSGPQLCPDARPPARKKTLQCNKGDDTWDK